MIDITKVLCDSSQSLEKLRQYLQKSNVVLIGCRKVSVSSCATSCLLETSSIDTMKGQKESVREPVSTGYFDLDGISPSAIWNLNDTLNVKKLLKQRGITPSACVRLCDIRLKRTDIAANGDMRSTYLGTVLTLKSFRYHSDSKSGLLLCSQSKILRDEKWVDLLVRYLKIIFKGQSVVILYYEGCLDNPGYTEFRKVVYPCQT